MFFIETEGCLDWFVSERISISEVPTLFNLTNVIKKNVYREFPGCFFSGISKTGYQLSDIRTDAGTGWTLVRRCLIYRSKIETYTSDLSTSAPRLSFDLKIVIFLILLLRVNGNTQETTVLSPSFTHCVFQKHFRTVLHRSPPMSTLILPLDCIIRYREVR